MCDGYSNKGLSVHIQGSRTDLSPLPLPHPQWPHDPPLLSPKKQRTLPAHQAPRGPAGRSRPSSADCRAWSAGIWPLAASRLRLSLPLAADCQLSAGTEGGHALRPAESAVTLVPACQSQPVRLGRGAGGMGLGPDKGRCGGSPARTVLCSGLLSAWRGVCT